MINKKEFDLLLQVIFQIENKIVEVKILNQFDKAKEYENSLGVIRLKAKDIVLDNENTSNGFDELSLEVLRLLILLDSDIDYYLLKFNNIIESASDNKIDAEALKRIKQLWESLEKDIKFWNKEEHNPIEEIEYNKHIGKITLDIIVFQLQTEGVLDFNKVFKYCKKEFLQNAIKEVLFEGASDEFKDEIRRRRLLNLAKNMVEKDLYDYKLWNEVLIIKNIRARDDHIEMIGNFQEKEKTHIVNTKFKNAFSSGEDISEKRNDLELLYEESIFKELKNWFSRIRENARQNKMAITWKTTRGPAFKIESVDGDIKFAAENINKVLVEKAKKLTIATNGVAKYNFEKGSSWENLEEIIFLDGKNIASVNLSPDKTYNCIGNDSFIGCTKLKNISFGNIEMIGERAFKNCTSLSEITFSENLRNIGEDAFCDCYNLTRVIFLGNLQLYILDRPQNIINCFKGTKLEEIIYKDIDDAFNFAIIDCPFLKRILISNLSNISIPFKTCKYRLGRQEGIVSFVGEKSLNLWKKKNSTIRFFELTEEDKKKYNIND